jgi:hypothetical protein
VHPIEWICKYSIRLVFLLVKKRIRISLKQEGFFGETKNIVLINSSYSGVKTSIEKLKLIHRALVSLGFGTNESCGKSASVQQKKLSNPIREVIFHG